MYRAQLLSPLSGVRNMRWKLIPGQATSQDTDPEVEMECVWQRESDLFNPCLISEHLHTSEHLEAKHLRWRTASHHCHSLPSHSAQISQGVTPLGHLLTPDTVSRRKPPGWGWMVGCGPSTPGARRGVQRGILGGAVGEMGGTSSAPPPPGPSGRRGERCPPPHPRQGARSPSGQRCCGAAPLPPSLPSRRRARRLPPSPPPIAAVAGTHLRRRGRSGTRGLWAVNATPLRRRERPSGPGSDTGGRKRAPRLRRRPSPHKGRSGACATPQGGAAPPGN